jgi:hypothetical protein
VKEFLYTKSGFFASVNITGTILSLFMANPLGFVAGVLAVVAGIFHVSITYHKWKTEKQGWGYSVMAKLFRWK